MRDPLTSARSVRGDVRLKSPPKPGPAGGSPSRRSDRALDWFVFFVADVQTGFGPFVAVYLTTQKWTQIDIGLVLTIGGFVGLLAQIPAGAIVDGVRSVRLAAAISLVSVALSAFALAIWPVYLFVTASRVLQAGASCVLGLAITRISLDLAGRNGASRRFGRNASFASVGTGLAAAGMGACGFYLSNRAVFVLAGLLAIPAVVALFQIQGMRRPPPKPRSRGTGTRRPALLSDLWTLVRIRPLMVFAVCLALFHLANASMLSLAASMLTLHAAEAASALVAASIVVPQLIVTVLSPGVASRAQIWGRKPLLAVGFLALALRGSLFAWTIDPRLLVAGQVLDGISAAVLGVLIPLTIADVTRGSGRFGLAQGVVGTAMGVGAALSTTLSGYLADTFNSRYAFMALASVAVVGLLGLLAVMPETRDDAATDD